MKRVSDPEFLQQVYNRMMHWKVHTVWLLANKAASDIFFKTNQGIDAKRWKAHACHTHTHACTNARTHACMHISVLKGMHSVMLLAKKATSDIFFKINRTPKSICMRHTHTGYLQTRPVDVQLRMVTFAWTCTKEDLKLISDILIFAWQSSSLFLCGKHTHTHKTTKPKDKNSWITFMYPGVHDFD